MYSCCHIGLRGVRSILEVLNELFSLNLASLPPYTSTRNWILKTGLSLYEEDLESEEDYMAVLDESMMIGGEKLLLTLTAKAQKDGKESLSKSDMRVAKIAVAGSFNAASISLDLSQTEEKMGKAPKYIVSDNDHKLALAVKEKDYPHLLDISHTTGLLLERTYKNAPEYISFSKDLSEVRLRDIMKKDTAYLLPPQQRTVARFMNVSHSIDWADKMLSILENLTKKEKEAFSFLKKHACFIEEFKAVSRCADSVSKLLKTTGFSYQSASKAIGLIRRLYMVANDRMRKFADSFIAYIQRERDKLDDQNSCWHISSDIIESTFGEYKERKASNRLYGITSFVLFLPVLMKFKKIEEEDTDIVSRALKSKKMADINTWSQNHLTENMVVKRSKVLKKAG